MPVERASRADKIPGVYAKLREEVVRDLEEGDPRALYMIDDLAERARLNETSPVLGQLRSRLAVFDAHKPVVIPAWKLGGNTIPEANAILWIADRVSTQIEVRADDTVRPVL
jgi:hypothetical protein